MGIRRIGTLGRPISEFARAERQRMLGAAAIVLVQNWKAELATPGRGRIRRTRRAGTVRKGKGAFRWVWITDAAGNRRRVRRMIRRGYARWELGDRASAPGDPPAPDFGTLQRSIDYEFTDEGTARAGTNVESAEPLEYGTVRILPRPHARPALAKSEDAMTDQVVAVLRGGGA